MTHPEKNGAFLAHQLIVALTLNGIAGACSCDVEFGEIAPGQSLDVFGVKWGRHAIEAVAR